MAAERAFEGRVAIVTGAGRGTGGIGRAIALRLAGAGAQVMVADVDARIGETADELRAAGAQAQSHVGSLAEEANVQAMVDRTVDAWGQQRRRQHYPAVPGA